MQHLQCLRWATYKFNLLLTTKYRIVTSRPRLHSFMLAELGFISILSSSNSLYFPSENAAVQGRSTLKSFSEDSSFIPGSDWIYYPLSTKYASVVIHRTLYHMPLCMLVSELDCSWKPRLCFFSSWFSMFLTQCMDYSSCLINIYYVNRWVNKSRKGNPFCIGNHEIFT